MIFLHVFKVDRALNADSESVCRWKTNRHTHSCANACTETQSQNKQTGVKTERGTVLKWLND